MTNDQQRIIENLDAWGSRNEWASKIAKTKLRHYQDKTNKDVIRRQVPETDRRVAR